MSLKAFKSSTAQETKIPSYQKGRKILNVTVCFLDDSSHVFQLQAKNLGEVLFEKVCKHINLIEVDYFGLECEDEKGSKFWLDMLKPLCSQVQTSFPTMYFFVKFYTPDPVQLEDEFTRYLFGLQIKKDLVSGALQCNDNTAAILISYIVQADFGDFNPEKCVQGSYLSSYKLIFFQDAELEKKIIENHKKLQGQTPSEADSNLLETARRCEMYGIKMSAAKDQEGVPLNLAVAHLGIVVFQNFTKINTFSWMKIRKLSFKRKKFLIKLHPENYSYYKDTVEFFFEGRNECKSFWKKCIENHTFFRCSDAKQGMRLKTKIFSRGSSFRYSGRTQKQVSEFIREQCPKRTQFQRSTSLKTPTSPVRSIGSPATVPQLLLPVSSQSCGSISEISKDSIVVPRTTSEPSTPHTTSDFNKSVKEENGSVTCIIPVSDIVSPESEQEKEVQSANYTVNDNADKKVLESPSHSDDNEVMEKDIIEKSAKSESNHNLKKLENNNSILADNSKEASKYPSDTKYTNGICPTKPTDHKRLNQQILSNTDTEDLTENSFESDSSLKDTEQNFNNSSFYISSPYAVKLSSKNKIISDKSYCLAKELLMTERTFRKDLEIVNVVFRDELNQFPNLHSEVLKEMLAIVDPLYEMHCSLLRDLEQRIALWEGRPVNQNVQVIKGVADIFLQRKKIIKVHCSYLEKLPALFEKLFLALNHNQHLAQFYQQFESQKVCYMPLSSFFLRSTFRIPYYQSFFQSLLNVYNSQHMDYNNCINILKELRVYCENFENSILSLVNYTKLFELQRNIKGFSPFVDKTRKFIREGCLLKFTKNGSHQRMFFLFSDVLLYTVRNHDGQFRFKVQGQLPCENVEIQETEPKYGVNNCFILCNPEKHLLMASPSSAEHDKWMQDLQKVIKEAKTTQNLGQVPSIDLSTPSLDDNLESGDEVSSLKEEKPLPHHLNTSIHICWHRNISISHKDLLSSMKNNLSGYLLRKFKNSSGWQKVWVVLANLCLFFYRSYLDECPLASLPLAGYGITTTTSSDLICGECVFKLMFKNHEYYFMVENKYSFERWMEAIRSCTLMEDEKTYL